MVNYNDMTVTIGPETGFIKDFRVWWMTPFGMCATLDEAKTKLNDNDMPLEILRPLTVAMCDNGLYEPII